MSAMGHKQTLEQASEMSARCLTRGFAAFTIAAEHVPARALDNASVNPGRSAFASGWLPKIEGWALGMSALGHKPERPKRELLQGLSHQVSAARCIAELILTSGSTFQFHPFT